VRTNSCKSLRLFSEGCSCSQPLLLARKKSFSSRPGPACRNPSIRIGLTNSQTTAHHGHSLHGHGISGERAKCSCGLWRFRRRDAPIPEAQLRAEGKSILELPAVLIGIVIIYELPDVKGELKFTGPVVANIFLGKIKLWNDPAIAKLNPEMNLPELPIMVLHRNEGKGSNYVLSDYLAKVSPEFLAAAGRGESPKWPVGHAFQRSQDLLAKLRGTPGAIGYTELTLPPARPCAWPA